MIRAVPLAIRSAPPPLVTRVAPAAYALCPGPSLYKYALNVQPTAAWTGPGICPACRLTPSSAMPAVASTADAFLKRRPFATDAAYSWQGGSFVPAPSKYLHTVPVPVYPMNVENLFRLSMIVMGARHYQVSS